jgi:hypothetical protein
MDGPHRFQLNPKPRLGMNNNTGGCSMRSPAKWSNPASLQWEPYSCYLPLLLDRLGWNYRWSKE